MQTLSSSRDVVVPPHPEWGGDHELPETTEVLPLPLLVHELRAPLQSIMAALDALHLLLDAPGASAGNAAGAATHLELVEAGQHAAQHLGELLRRLREQPELTPSGGGVDARPFDLLDTIEAVFEIVAPFAQSHGIETAFSITSTVEIRLTGDRLRLKQALLNLVRNGMRRVLASGSADKRVTVRLGRADGRHDVAEVTVSDNGPPLPAGIAEHIFEPFAQPHDSARDGSGLGLAIAKHYIEAMGARIEFAPDGGEPCRFVVTLPLAPARAHKLPLAGVAVATPADARHASLRNTLASLGATLQDLGAAPRQTVVTLAGAAQPLDALAQPAQLIEVLEPISPNELIGLLQEHHGCPQGPVRSSGRRPMDLAAAPRLDALLQANEAVIAAFGQSAPVTQVQIFLAVAQDHYRGAETLMSALPERLGLHRRTVSRHLAALGRWGTHHKRGLELIDSAPSFDHRTKVLALTRAGVELADRLARSAAAGKAASA